MLEVLLREGMANFRAARVERVRGNVVLAVVFHDFVSAVNQFLRGFASYLFRSLRISADYAQMTAVRGGRTFVKVLGLTSMKLTILLILFDHYLRPDSDAAVTGLLLLLFFFGLLGFLSGS